MDTRGAPMNEEARRGSPHRAGQRAGRAGGGGRAAGQRVQEEWKIRLEFIFVAVTYGEWRRFEVVYRAGRMQQKYLERQCRRKEVFQPPRLPAT